MGQVFGKDIIGTITNTTTTITIAASRIKIMGQQYSISQKIINAAAVGINGIDTGALGATQFYYIYAVRSGSNVGYVISLSSSSPTGFTQYSRIGQTTTNGSSQLVTAGLFAEDDGFVGQVLAANLDEPTFRAVHGAGWVLADGRNVAGSKYATVTGSSTVPDYRGQFLRGKNNGRSDGNQDPGGERALGNYQSDENKSHRHPFKRSTGGSFDTATDGGHYYDGFDGIGNYPDTSTNAGGLESRPRNTVVNYFIKIN